jgi:hypothetical protein
MRPGYTLYLHDQRYIVIPMFHWAQTQLHAGRLPLLAPIFGGYPLYADPSALTFYPFAFLVGFLPTLAAFQALTVLHLAVSFAGCYILGRHLRMDRASSLLIGLVWTASDFFVGRLDNCVVMFYAMAWWPWLLWSLLRLDERVNPGRFLAAVGFGVLEMLAGHPQFMIYFALLWLGWLAIGPLERRRRSALASAGVALCVLSLTAFAWMPGRMLAQQSERAAADQSFIGVFSMTLAWLPKYILGARSGANVCFGIVALILALLGAWHPRRWSIAVVGLIALFMSFSQGNPIYRIVSHLPLLNQFRASMRYVGITVFLFSVLAGYGLTRLGHRKWLQCAILIIVGLALIFAERAGRPHVTPYASLMWNSAAVEALRSRPRAPYFLYTEALVVTLFDPGSANELADPRCRLMPNANLLWDLPSVQGLTPLPPLRQARFLNMYGGSCDALALNRPPRRAGRLRMLSRLGCRYILSTAPLGELSHCAATRLSDGMVLYDLGAAPIALATRGSQIRSYRAGPQAWQVEGYFEQPQAVIFAIGYWPELRGWVDGRQRPVRASGPNPSIEVPRGEHCVRLEYIPTSLYQGLAASGVSLLVLGGIMLELTRRRRCRACEGDKHTSALAESPPSTG